MVIVFEDKKTSGISRLIERAYLADEYKLYFAGGNENILNVLGNERGDGIVYVDVVPDKPSTINAFNKVYSGVKGSGLYVIPIPCIEYYMIKTFCDTSKPETRCLMEGGNYRLNKKNSNGKALATNDLETYCKSVLKNYRGCYRKKGNFYKYDCFCPNIEDKTDCHEMSITEKGCRLVCSLPVFADMKNNSFINIGKVDIKEKEQICRREYYSLAQKFLDLGMIEQVYQLVE
jgi:hypothetical protein